MDIKPGSMGMPLPGIEAAVVNRKDGGVTPCKPGEIGDLALKSRLAVDDAGLPA
jgi:acetyl-CoA synthetase